MTLRWNQFPLNLVQAFEQAGCTYTYIYISIHVYVIYVYIYIYALYIYIYICTLTHIEPPSFIRFLALPHLRSQWFWSRCSDKWDQCKRLEPQIRKFCARLQMFWEGFFPALLLVDIYYEMKSHGSHQHKTKWQYLFWLVCILPGLCRNLRNQTILPKSEKKTGDSTWCDDVRKFVLTASHWM